MAIQVKEVPAGAPAAYDGWVRLWQIINGVETAPRPRRKAAATRRRAIRVVSQSAGASGRQTTTAR